MTDQLEIIHKSGDIRFYALDASKGLTNIGRHPENDVVLDSPTVDAFHAVLDHRQKPYQLMLLSAWGNPRVGGQSVPSQSTLTIMPWDTVEIDGYALMVVEGNTTPTIPTSPPAYTHTPLPEKSTAPPQPFFQTVPAQPAAVPLPAPLVPNLNPGPTSTLPVPMAANVGNATLPGDRTDEQILVQFQTKAGAIDPEQKSLLAFSVEVNQTASFDVIVKNGGSLVATFQVSVQGLPPGWMSVSPGMINLNEAQSASMQVNIIPPRTAEALAGVHNFAVIVASPEYRNHYHITNGQINIKPFHEFSLGELSPKEQSISFTKRIGQFTIPIANKGNGAEVFHISVEDNERGCHFEFDKPNEAPQSRALETTIPVNTSADITARVIPMKRQFIGFSGRTYNYTVTVTTPQSLQAPRSLLGQVKTSPFIGPIPIILFGLLLVGLIVWFSMPGVKIFTATGPSSDLMVDALSGNTLFVKAGETVTLNWEAAPFFTDLRLVNQDTKEVVSEIGQSDEPRGRTVLSPTVNTKYQLEATTWLSKIYPGFTALAVIPVSVAPVKPRWISYTGGKLNILRGQNVVYTWKVEYAETVFLVTLVNNVETRTPVPADQVGQGSLTLTPNDNTTYYLTAHNRYTSEQGEVTPEQLLVSVLDPTTTPPPDPVIVRFDVQPDVIIAGESVRVDWSVTGIVAGGTVHLNGTEQAPNGSQEFFPTENTVFTLVAKNGDKQDTQSKTVRVNPAPSPTPTAAPPIIKLFAASPNPVVAGAASGGTTKLTWSISGNVTSIKLSGPNRDMPLTEKEGSFSVAVTEESLFVLTAYNGDASAVASVTVGVLAATPTPLPPPTLLVTVTSVEQPASRVTALQTSTVPGGSIQTYAVVQGTSLAINWSSVGATSVIYNGIPGHPATGSLVVPVFTRNAYTSVVAVNATTAYTVYLDLLVVSPEPPPPPYDLSATFISSSTVNVTWLYTASALSTIQYFRVHKRLPTGQVTSTDVPFTLPDPIPDPMAFAWQDMNATTCAEYYVTAVYYTAGGQLEQTRGGPVWGVCPTALTYAPPQQSVLSSLPAHFGWGALPIHEEIYQLRRGMRLYLPH